MPRKTGQEFSPPSIREPRSKGSHGRLWVGRRFTMVARGELKPGTFHNMLKQLGIRQEDF